MHTKGPWEAVRDETDSGWYVRQTPPPGFVGERWVASGIRQPSASDGEDDARLIASAPDLLDALEDLLADMAVDVLEDAARSDPNDTDSAKSTAAKFRAARAAIKRARPDTEG